MKDLKWHLRFLDMAELVATWSKDTTKIGCVIVGPDREVRGVGYNGFPRGINDDIPERHERPEKYLWTAHAERNALDNALLVGIPVRGCTLYLNWTPCAPCAQGIVQTGIARVISSNGSPSGNAKKWAEDFRVAAKILGEAKIPFVGITRGEYETDLPGV